MRYVSQKLRDEIALKRFRDALSGKNRKESPTETLRDHGITDPIKQDDIEAASLLVGQSEHNAHREEQQMLGAPDLPEEQVTITMKPEGGMLARIFSKNVSPRAARAESVVSRSSSGMAYETPEYPHKDIKISADFHRLALNPANNADPSKRDVNAVLMVMENLLDWDFHAKHHGDTLTAQLLDRLAKTLVKTVESICPDVANRAALAHFETIAANNWMGDFSNIRTVTQNTVRAYLEAQNGNGEPLAVLEKSLAGIIRFKERFYSDVSARAEIPLRALANAMEKQGSRPLSPALGTR